MKKISGFTLVELIITLAMIGILSGICLPVYSQHITHAHRLEAELSLIKLSNALEKYYLLNNTYENATFSKLNFSDITPSHHYQLHIVSTTSSDFLIKAVPLGNQA